MGYKTRLPGRWQKMQRHTAFVHVSAANVDAGQAVAENGDYVKASLEKLFAYICLKIS